MNPCVLRQLSRASRIESRGRRNLHAWTVRAGISVQRVDQIAGDFFQDHRPPAGAGGRGLDPGFQRHRSGQMQRVGVVDGDDIVRATSSRAPEAGPTASALSLLAHEPGLSIRTLAIGVGLSHAGTVRLVDRLATEGFDGLG